MLDELRKFISDAEDRKKKRIAELDPEVDQEEIEVLEEVDPRQLVIARDVDTLLAALKPKKDHPAAEALWKGVIQAKRSGAAVCYVEAGSLLDILSVPAPAATPPAAAAAAAQPTAPAK